MKERCEGCGAVLDAIDAPVHAYMRSSPSCFHAFNELLVVEYSRPDLRDIHRLTVDTWAVQHPGRPDDRRAVQSVGLHLARLLLQLEKPRSPQQTNAVMLDFSRRKKTLLPLAPPKAFRMTATDVAPHAGGPMHESKIREWAASSWQDWSAHHSYIRAWIAENSNF